MSKPLLNVCSPCLREVVDDYFLFGDWDEIGSELFGYDWESPIRKQQHFPQLLIIRGGKNWGPVHESHGVAGRDHWAGKTNGSGGMEWNGAEADWKRAVGRRKRSMDPDWMD